ncbi:MAG: hypothetical protein ABWZ76_10170 [Acidimicrobiales bacterium]
MIVGSLVALVGLASPAAADPAGPSDSRSEVTGLVPDVDGVRAVIRGGDSFLEISVDEGHNVTVAGYNDEPYLQVLEDGKVQRNRLSSATYLNDDRKGAVDIPAEVKDALESGADPEWETIGDGGTYAWHDHRVHWMAEVSPPVERGERVAGAYDPWVVPITVDGAPVEIRGTLTYARATSPLPWVLLAVIVAGTLVWFGRRLGLRLAATVMVLVSAVALVVGRADWAATPDGAGNPLLWALPVIALVAALGAAAFSGRSAGVILALASVAALSGWAIFRVEVLVKPVLPTELPFALDRATVAVAVGASLAAAYLAITSGALSLPDLDDD